MKDYTVKEIAELLEVSKPTVQKMINDLGIEFITKGKRDRFYTEDNVIEIIKAINPNFDLSKIIEKTAKTENEPQNIEESTENIEKDTENTEKDNANTEKDRKIEDLQMQLLETLQKQIADQQKQLESKDQEIQHLHKLLDQQQVLTLQANQKIELLENKQVDKPEEPEEVYEKSWFGLFKKVKK